MILDLVDDAFRSVFRKTKLRIRVVVVEYVFDAEQPERQRNQECCRAGLQPRITPHRILLRADETYVMAVCGQRQCHFPYPRIKWYGLVFDNDEDFPSFRHRLLFAGRQRLIQPAKRAQHCSLSPV